MSIVLSEEEKAFLRHVSEIFTLRKKQVFRAKILGLKQREIAFILGVSIPTVCRELKEVEKIVKKRGQNSDYL